MRIAFAALVLLPLVASAAEGPADLVLRNGKVYAVDPSRSVAQAVAVRGNTILAVGTNAEIDRLTGPSTEVVDLAGRLLLPGLIDAHTHPIYGAVNAAKCSLDGVDPTIEQIAPVVQDCLKGRPGGAEDWMEVVQLSNYGFEATAADLDRITSERPLVLLGNDGHTAWVNTVALKLTGITRDTPDPEGGKIAHDAQGEPTGFLADNAMMLATKLIPAPSTAERADATAAALKDMNAVGITSLQDAYVSPDDAAVWALLYRSGRLPMRVREVEAFDDLSDGGDAVIEGLKKGAAEATLDPDRLRMDSVKIFADGVIEAPTQTAALIEPYLDADGKPTENRGELYFEQEKANNIVTKLDAAGLTVHVHAIGDRAARASLDAFAASRAKNGVTDNRHQIAHLQLVDPADFGRFADLGVLADFQLLWAVRDSSNEGPLEPYLGPERYRYMYPAGSILKAGGTIVGGSDWDVSSFDPFAAMQHAILRVETEGKPPLELDEALRIEDVVAAYTINAAFALKQETTTGSIEPGKRADLVVVDRDIFGIDPHELKSTRVDLTYLDGKEIYRRAQ